VESEQVLEHPEYAKDSYVSEGICYDLLKRCSDVASGATLAPELLGDFIR
jgi:hypothetical protein